MSRTRKNRASVAISGSDIWKFVALWIALIIVPVKASASPCTPISFGTTPPKTGAISVSGETDCFTFTGAVGDTVRVRVIKTSGTFAPFTDVVRPNGQTCISSVVPEFNCAVNSVGTHKILVRDFSPGTRTGKYSLYIQRLNNPVGCTAISFGTTPPKTGAINVAAETDCFIFTGAVGDTVRVRVIKTSGTFGPLTDVVRPNGQTCISFVVSEFNCAVNSAGTHTILVRDFSPGTRTGKYSLYIQRFKNPVACTSIGTQPKTGTIGVAAETDCFTFTGAVGDTVRVRVIKTSGTFGPLTDVVRPNGQTCISFVVSEFNCAVNSAGTHTILVRDFSPGTRTGMYRMNVSKL